MKARSTKAFLHGALVALAVALAGCRGTGAFARESARESAREPGRASASAGSESETRAAIGRVLDDFHDAAAHADEARYFAHFAPSGVFLGTDAKERWDVDAFKAYAHPHFAAGKAWSFRAVERHVAIGPDGGVAWFDERLETGRLGPARGSGVLIRDGATWKVAQYNLSIPIPNERFDEVKKVIERP